MRIGNFGSGRAVVGMLLAGLMMVGVSACANVPARGGAEGAAATPADAAAGPVAKSGAPAAEQEVFASDQEAMAALLKAAEARDHAALDRLFGPAAKDLVSGDPVEDQRGFDSFVKHATEQMRLEKVDETRSIVHIGAKDWPFPIPLVKSAEGKWFFDTVAGEQEILARRVGRNELHTIAVCREYVAAQREYATEDHDGSGVLKYAQRLVSHAGKKDGLFWEAAAGEEESPFGPLVAQATMEGYATGPTPHREPFHGYYFHVLKQQGPAAPGGAYEYVINGKMIAGFALVAWPADYGNAGVMTFIVNHQGKVYQKDLGPKTTELVKRMKAYNPDGTWTLAER